MTKYRVGYELTFPLPLPGPGRGRLVNVISAVDEEAGTVTFHLLGDPEDSTTETIADLDEAEVIVREPRRGGHPGAVVHNHHRQGDPMTENPAPIERAEAQRDFWAAEAFRLADKEGWVPFGTHLDVPGDVDFDGQDQAGEPLWERSVAVGDQLAQRRAAIAVSSYMQSLLGRMREAKMPGLSLEAVRSLADQATEAARELGYDPDAEEGT